MSAPIERVRLSAAAKQHRSTLKRRTGIEHYNVSCRLALCASLTNSTKVPDEALQYSGGSEIEWKTFAGETEATLTNLMILRALRDEEVASASAVCKVLQAHVHRGFGVPSSGPNITLCKRIGGT